MLSSLNNRPISLVDMVIRKMLDDVDLKTDAIITFNPGDFDDVCRKNKKMLIFDSRIASALG